MSDRAGLERSRRHLKGAAVHRERVGGVAVAHFLLSLTQQIGGRILIDGRLGEERRGREQRARKSAAERS